jgi:hypothetical protein
MRQGATYIGNTGFGYGDSDLIAYSERLMVNFVEELEYAGNGAPTVGRALMLAKQRYYNSAGLASLSNYDEKVMAVMTLYGLPMLQVEMPNAAMSMPGAPPEGVFHTAAQSPDATIMNNLNAAASQPYTLTLTYDAQAVDGRGTYYTLAGQSDLFLTAGRPVQPRVTALLPFTDTLALGV